MIERRRKPIRTMDLQILYPVAVLVVLWYLMWRLGRRARTRVASEPRMWGKRELAREESALSNKEDELEIRLHEKSREVTARIDAKLAVLQELISRAESVAARLERALAASRVPENGNASGPPPGSVMDDSAVLAPTDRDPTDSEGEGDPSEALWDEVRSLAAYGFSPAEISQQLGIAEERIRRKLAQ
ncbi:hypothetical protein [Thermopirellula anaerolimosa]